MCEREREEARSDDDDDDDDNDDDDEALGAAVLFSCADLAANVL